MDFSGNEFKNKKRSPLNMIIFLVKIENVTRLNRKIDLFYVTGVSIS